jgi:hypothetical protein
MFTQKILKTQINSAILHLSPRPFCFDIRLNEIDIGVHKAEIILDSSGTKIGLKITAAMVGKNNQPNLKDIRELTLKFPRVMFNQDTVIFYDTNLSEVEKKVRKVKL